MTSHAAVDDVLVVGDRVALRESWTTADGLQRIAFLRFADGSIAARGRRMHRGVATYEPG